MLSLPILYPFNELGQLGYYYVCLGTSRPRFQESVGSDVLSSDNWRTGEQKEAVQRSTVELDGVAPMGDKAVFERPPSSAIQ
ncbi:hypothetical protein CORC01_12516 [Colletotrichum orchidophilum]|uniref:Uncharacterized protein n=1 Tax=Colletotrichum orchidophilum TaxID=1209926 RepID=A0A1G4ASU0_9PEZI|nr:uncharacterized protein CORC01_12516 [Colletotrichum orchidophilum]OHE92171.1 hypothetical protein CORC01_12516 [Colletotrichum orchidophilum]